MSTRKTVNKDGSVSTKDDTGTYELTLPAPIKVVEQTISEISIDNLMNAGLQNIQGAMRAVTTDVGTGMPSRETIQNLKDLMGLLRDLKKDEQDLLTDLSEEQLEKLLKK